MAYYNGYCTEERDKKLKELKRLVGSGEIPAALPPCDLCGDPEKKTEYHSEDYSRPFIFQQYKLCRGCHRTYLHGRFRRPARWRAFKAHLRRGGYARDLVESAELKKEVEALTNGGGYGDLPFLRFRNPDLTDWWEELSTNPLMLTAFDARPRASVEFASAWQQVKPCLTETEHALLHHHLRAPGHTLSWSELAKKMGYASFRGVNSNYGKLAKKLVRHSTYRPERRATTAGGQPKYLMILCHPADGGDNQMNKHIRFRLNHSVLSTLQLDFG